MKPITADDPLSKSADLVAENLDRLREILPQVFTEDGIDFDVLRDLLGDAVAEGEERYGLNWHGKARARRLALTPSTGTLRPAKEESVDWETTQNLIIEGDNLEVLKLLQKSYAGRVKLIYIDPPYNTGKDFVYKDDYRDNIRNYMEKTGQVDSDGVRVSTNSETSGRYHTDWLNMMYPRLMLARQLLEKDGAIFVSIDDNEVQNLRQMMDEVFGPENFIATIIWQKVYAPKNSAKHFSEDHDYVVVYGRSAANWVPKALPRTVEQDALYKNPDNDPRGPWMSDNLTARNYYGEGTYAVTSPTGRTISGPPSGRYWAISKTKFDELNKDDRIWWGKDGTNMPRLKRFLSEVANGRVPQTLWQYDEVGHTQEAKKELLKRVSFESSDSVFDTPKPPRLIQQMLRIATRSKEGDIVLDFFAGSGTTGDSVLGLNAEDEGNRRYILVQLPERTEFNDYPTIAEITKERMRNASQEFREENPELAEKQDLGFRVFKLDSTNLKPWDPQPEDLQTQIEESVEHVKAGRTEADLLYEVLLKLGLDLSVPIETREITGFTVHNIGAGQLMACLGTGISREDAVPLGRGIAEWQADSRPAAAEDTTATILFRDSGFADDVTKQNLLSTLQQAGLSNIRSI